MSRYQALGPFNGATECDPPEPGKWWIEIADVDEFGADELAVVVSRGSEPSDEKWEIAFRIVAAMNATQDAS